MAFLSTLKRDPRGHNSVMMQGGSRQNPIRRTMLGCLRDDIIAACALPEGRKKAKVNVVSQLCIHVRVHFKPYAATA